jgi:tetratricopeptide (TPR) repeat protein
VRASIDEMSRALARWDDAIRTYRAVLRDTVGHVPDAHVALAAVYVERGKGRDALKEATAAGQLDPWRGDALVLQALAHDLEGHPADAARALAKASTFDRGEAASYALAQHLILLGDEAGASAALRRFHSAVEKELRGASASPAAAPFVRIGLLRQSPGVAPLLPPAAYTAGFTLLARGAYDRAVAELKQAVAHDSLGARDIVQDDDTRLGAAAFRRGDLDAALERFRTAVEKAPDSAEARRMLGLVYKADEQYEASVEQLRVAVKLNAMDDRARVALADVLVLMGRLEDAEQVLREAIAVLPNGGRAHYQLAQLYKTSGRSANAIAELEKVATFEAIAGQDHVYDELGVWYTADANLDGARTAYRKRIDVNPNNSDAHRKLGQIYLEQSRHEDAEAELSAALLLDPQNAEAHASRAQLHLRLGEYADAETSARRALALNRSHIAARYALGAALLRLGRTEDGTRELEEFQRLQTDALARANQEWQLKLTRQAAQASLDAADFTRAVDLLQQAVSLDPDSASAHMTLGIVLERAGRHADAVEVFHQALARGAGLEVHRRLAASYAALGRWQESQAEEALYRRAMADRVREASR